MKKCIEKCLGKNLYWTVNAQTFFYDNISTSAIVIKRRKQKIKFNITLQFTNISGKGSCAVVSKEKNRVNK